VISNAADTARTPNDAAARRVVTIVLVDERYMVCDVRVMLVCRVRSGIGEVMQLRGRG
jgi:hypothetical protein